MSAAPRRCFTGGKRAKDARGTLKRLIGYIAKGNKARLVCVFILLIISTVASVSASLFLKSLIDDYIAPLIGQSAPSFAPLLQALTMMGCIYLAGMLASYLQTRLMIPVAQGTLKTIRDDMFAHMQTLPIKYFDTHTHGNVMSYYTNDTDTLRQMISQSLPNAVSSIISITAVFIAMLSTSVWLTLLMFVFLGLMLFVVKNVGGGSAKYFVKQQQSLGKVNGFIEEMIGGQKVVKVFCHEEQNQKDFDVLNNEFCENATKANTYANIMMPIMGNLGHLQYVLVAIVGGLLAIAAVPNLTLTGIGTMTLGSIASFLQLSRSFTMPISQVSQQINSVVMALAGAERIFELMDEPSEEDHGEVALVNAEEKDGTLAEADHRTGIWAWKKPLPEGGYELISGHRRKRGCEMAGLQTMPVIIRDLDDDAAVLVMVDSNIQREELLPSERAFAYKMKLEALKHQGARSDLTSMQVAQKLSVEIVGEAAGESKDQVRRYIRLTNLIPEILQMVDDGKIALTPAVELSYLQPPEQETLFSIMDCDEVTPSLSQAQRLRRMSEEQRFTDSAVMQLMSEVKGNQVEYVKVPVDKLRSYFRPDTSMKQMTETLVKAMDFYNKHLERQRQDRDAR